MTDFYTKGEKKGYVKKDSTIFGLMVFKWVVGRTDHGEIESAFIPVRFEVTLGRLVKMFSKQLEIQKSELSLCILREGCTFRCVKVRVRKLT